MRWLFILLFAFPNAVLSQFNWQQDILVHLNFNLGLTYGAGINIGGSFNVGVALSNDHGKTAGISLGYNTVKADNGWHKLKSLNGYYRQNEYTLEVGFGQMHFGYNYKKGNSTTINGLLTDLSFKHSTPLIPAIGYNGFFFNKKEWSWFDFYYHSLYGAYNAKLERFDP